MSSPTLTAAQKVQLLTLQVQRARYLLDQEQDEWSKAVHDKWMRTTKRCLQLSFVDAEPYIADVLPVLPPVGGDSINIETCRQQLLFQLSRLEALVEQLEVEETVQSIIANPAKPTMAHDAINAFIMRSVSDESLMPRRKQLAAKENSIDVFISHSANDEQLAVGLCDLICRALKVDGQRIRCTSVAGHKLPGGADIASRLREEIRSCRVFLAILTEASDASAYVMAEIGARWMAGGHAVILRGADFHPSQVRGPFADTNSLSLDSDGDLLQMVRELAHILSVAQAPPESYSRQLRTLVRVSVPPDRRPTAVRDAVKG